MKDRHNSYDYECVKWFGDRSPARNRKVFGGWKPVEARHRWFGGDTMRFNEHRCLICNPYDEPEANNLLGWI